MLFHKKDRAPKALPEDRWAVHQGIRLGAPIVLRVNETARDYAANPDLPIRLGVAIPLHEPDGHGFPRSGEIAQLAAIEDELFAAINAAGVGRLVLVISTGGMREFISYVRSEADAQAAVSRVRQAIGTHEIQSCTVEDGQWSCYREFDLGGQRTQT